MDRFALQPRLFPRKTRCSGPASGQLVSGAHAKSPSQGGKRLGTGRQVRRPKLAPLIKGRASAAVIIIIIIVITAVAMQAAIVPAARTSSGGPARIKSPLKVQIKISGGDINSISKKGKSKNGAAPRREFKNFNSFAERPEQSGARSISQQHSE